MGLTVNALLLEGGTDFLSLTAEDVLRTHNPPWTVILSGDDEHGAEHLMTLARRVTGPCLYFHYFDDEMFFLHLYVDGKRVASLSTQPEAGRTSHVERISWAFFGDDSITPALKLISKTVMVEEQLALAEEALGVSLADHVEFEPRIVPQGRAVFDEVTARLKELKNRKNAYKAIPVAEEDIPPVLRSWEKPDPSGQPGLRLVWSNRHKGPNTVQLRRAEDNVILHEGTVNGEIFERIWWMPEFRQYAIFSRKEWIDGAGWHTLCTLLDDKLQLLREFYLPPRTWIPSRMTRLEGTTFWSDMWKDDRIQILDIADLSLRYIKPEDRVFFAGLPTEELIFGCKGDRDVILFDRTGRLVSRHRFKGEYVSLSTVDGVIYVLEEVSSCEKGQFTRFWRLEKI